MSHPLRKKRNQAQEKGENKISDVEQRQILMEVNSMGVNGSKTVMESFWC